jgi:hypothetical protein
MIYEPNGKPQDEERRQDEKNEEIQINPEWMDSLEKGAKIGRSEEADTSEEETR